MLYTYFSHANRKPLHNSNACTVLTGSTDRPVCTVLKLKVICVTGSVLYKGGSYDSRQVGSKLATPPAYQCIFMPATQLPWQYVGGVTECINGNCLLGMRPTEFFRTHLSNL